MYCVMVQHRPNEPFRPPESRVLYDTEAIHPFREELDDAIGLAKAIFRNNRRFASVAVRSLAPGQPTVYLDTRVGLAQRAPLYGR